MLELKGIGKTYRTGETVTALKGLSLQVEEGEFLAIVGPSGCGKSTLLHILGLLDGPDEGEYLIDGQATSRLSARVRSRMRNRTFGFVFQSFNLLSRTSALENVLLPLRYRSGVIDRTKTAAKMLGKVGLLERQNSHPNQLSGGQQQRVAIARALVGDPQVILADEPTGNLDSKTGRDIMELFKSIHQQGKTVIVVTHNEELLASAKRVIRMRDGRIIGDR